MSLAGPVARLRKRQEGAACRRQAHVSRAEHRPLDCRKRTVRAGSQYTSVEFDLFAVEFLGGKRVARSGQRTSQFPGSTISECQSLWVLRLQDECERED